MVLTIALALAHVPHDTVRAVATPADGAWWLSALYGSAELLARSEDRGLTWTFVGGPVLAERPKGIVALDDGTIVVLTARQLWWTTDGSSWASGPTPAEVAEIRGGATLVLAGPGGLWEGSPDVLVQRIDAPVRSLGSVAVGTDGTLWLADQGWAEGPSWPGATAATVLGPVVYVGDADGNVHQFAEGAWVECGALPEAEHRSVVGLEADGGLLLVATAWRTPFVSGDGCASWEDRGTGADAEYDVAGGAHDEADAWPILTVDGDTWVVGGWAGIYTSHDEGHSWTDGVVLPADFTRGALWDSNYQVSGRIWVGSYAGAVGYTDDGGASFDFGAHGLYDEDVQHLGQLRQPSAANAVFAVSGWNVWASDDGGASWVARDAPTEEARAFEPMGNAGHYWVLGRSSAGPDYLESTDAGRSWATLTSLATAAAGAQGVGVLRVDAASICVTTSAPSLLLCTADGGTTWASAAGDAESSRVTPPVGWPYRSPSRVFWADDAGLHRSDPLVGTVIDSTPTGQDPPDRLVVTDDDELILATRSGSLWRSLDGGDTWEDLALRVASLVESFHPHPRFEANPLVLLGTFDGMYILDLTDTPALRRWGRLQRIDNVSDFLTLSGDCPERVRVTDAAMDSLQPFPAGCSALTWMRGEQIEVLGQGAGGIAQLWVDGVFVAELTEPDDDGLLARVADLPDTWHRVGIEGAVGDGVLLDALQSRAAYDLVPLPGATAPRGPEPDCGCAHGRGTASWLFLPGLAALCQRRRGSRPGRAARRPRAREGALPEGAPA